LSTTICCIICALGISSIYRKYRFSRRRTTITSLPTEVILRIADELPLSSCVIFSLTCGRLREILLPRIYRLSTPDNKKAAERYFRLLSRDYYNPKRFAYPCFHCLRIITWPVLCSDDRPRRGCPHLLFSAWPHRGGRAIVDFTCCYPPQVRLRLHSTNFCHVLTS
jgi:hypothetical protein